MNIPRRRLADYVKKLHQKVFRTCSTIIFLIPTIKPLTCGVAVSVVIPLNSLLAGTHHNDDEGVSVIPERLMTIAVRSVWKVLHSRLAKNKTGGKVQMTTKTCGEIADIWGRSLVSVAFAICQSNLCNACSSLAECEILRYQRSHVCRRKLSCDLDPFLFNFFCCCWARQQCHF